MCVFSVIVQIPNPECMVFKYFSLHVHVYHNTAKGRTNIELREQFILAEGVSQSLAPFKPKPSPNSSVSSQSGTNSMPSTGPITKVCFLFLN